ncbi:MAG TPA: RHS repeat-associated core domain-containing protein [Anaerolineales bacterium]|nr:RHS repeat-associated core domain-containing protein [Anaerolineales bacterium]
MSNSALGSKRLLTEGLLATHTSYISQYFIIELTWIVKEDVMEQAKHHAIRHFPLTKVRVALYLSSFRGQLTALQKSVMRPTGRLFPSLNLLLIIALLLPASGVPTQSPVPVNPTGARSDLMANGEPVQGSTAVTVDPVSKNDIAPVQYTMIDLTSTDSFSSAAVAINNAGQVIGNIGTTGSATHAFLWADGVRKALGHLGGGYSTAVAINEAGQVIGSSYYADGYIHAFVWQGGGMRDLGTLGGKTSAAVAINEAGQVIGWAQIANNVNSHAFLWEDGVMTDLGTLGGRFSYPIAINEAGQVLGTSDVGGREHAFLWEDGVMTDLTPADSSSSGAVAINDAGQVIVASSPVNSPPRPFLWEDGVMTNLGTLGTYAEPVAINQAGQVIGRSGLAVTLQEHAFLWEDGAMRDLGTLGGYTGIPVAINDVGQVIGYSTRLGSETILRGVVWRNGMITELGTLGLDSTTIPVAINKVGQIVGNSPSMKGEHAFVWQDGVMTDLGTLGGWASEAIAINEAGQVIGSADLADGRKHAYLATPAANTNMEDPSIRCSDDRRPNRSSNETCPNVPPGESQCVGKPISVVAGNMYLDQTDIVIPIPGIDLEFVRSYNSQLAYRNIAGGFGPGWTYPYEQNLSFPSTGIIMLRRGDGVPAYFQDMDADLTYDASVPFTKESWIEKQADGTYIRHLRKGGYETYDNAGRLTSLVDAFGNTTTLGRDGSHRLTSIESPGSRSLTLTYNASNRIATLSGPAGLIATYSYDASKRLEKVTYADDRGYTLSYDSNNQLLTVSDLSGKVLETHTYSGNKAITSEISDGREKYTLSYKPLQTTVTDALGNATTYDWTNIAGMKHVTKITGPCASCGSDGNQTQQWTYDDRGRVLSYTDGNGNQTTYVYDANGDLISETDADKNTTTYTIGSDGRRTSMTVKSVVNLAQDKVTLYEYDRGNLKTQTEQGLLGDGTQHIYTTSYAYDTAGNLTSIDGPRTDVSDVMTFGYDSQTGDLTSLTQPQEGTTSYSNFTPLGQPQTVTDPNGLVTTYKYDPQRRILSTAIGGDTTIYTYTPSGKLSTITLPRGNKSSYVYDTFDWLVSIRDPLGNAIQFTYDLMGQPTKGEITDPNGSVQKWMDFEYDGLNRLQKIVNPDRAFTEYGYDKAGNRTSMTTPRGDTTTYKYDSLNRLRVTIQPGTITTTYGYDTQDNLTSVTDPNDHVTTYFYDDLGRVYRELSPDTGTTTYTYDEAGNRISKTDARSVTVRYKYDALNRLTQIDFSSDTDISYIYDTCQNGKGRLCQVADQSGTTKYSYDIKGQLLEEDQTVTGVSGVYVTRYGYDPNGNLISMTYPSGRRITYTFDMADRVTSVSTKRVIFFRQMLARDITYKPFGGISSFTYGNGLTRAVSYDNQYRITDIQSGSVQHSTYVYDSNGNIKEIKDPIDPARNQAYDYDPLNRLQGATGPWGSLAWTYDGVGNRLMQTDNTGNRAYTYQPENNQLARISGPSPTTFEYDLSGNTTSENTRHYVYTENGRLSQASAGPATLGGYTYNANGQRVKKTAGSATTVFHYDQRGQLIAETRADGSLVGEYIYLNGEPLAKLVGSMLFPTVSYIHTDHLGTPVAMTNARRTKVWNIEAGPFGDEKTITGAATLNLRFPGQYFDQETGLHQNRFRDYHPTIGRYLQSDPYRFGFLTEDSMALGGGPNAYLYVSENPINYLDPLGLQQCTNEQALNKCVSDCVARKRSELAEPAFRTVKSSAGWAHCAEGAVLVGLLGAEIGALPGAVIGGLLGCGLGFLYSALEDVGIAAGESWANQELAQNECLPGCIEQMTTKGIDCGCSEE